MQDIRAVLFDWGGVLIDNPASALIIYSPGRGRSVEDFTRVHDKHGQAFDKGWIPENQFWRQVCGDLGRPLPETPSLWGQAFRAVYSPVGRSSPWQAAYAPEAARQLFCRTPNPRRWSSSSNYGTTCSTCRSFPRRGDVQAGEGNL